MDVTNQHNRLSKIQKNKRYRLHYLMERDTFWAITLSQLILGIYLRNIYIRCKYFIYMKLIVAIENIYPIIHMFAKNSS